VTVRERVDVELRYPTSHPGTPHAVKADWRYARDHQRLYSHAVAEANTNEQVPPPAVTSDRPQRISRARSSTFWRPRGSKERLQLALRHLLPAPAPGQRTDPHAGAASVSGKALAEVERLFPDWSIPTARFYYGRIGVETIDPLGPWRTHLFAQTVNGVPPDRPRDRRADDRRIGRAEL
jgi:hypothetical protein